MRVVVPSMGRTFDVRTILDLYHAGLAPLVVVPQKEIKAYAEALPMNADVVGHPASVKGIAKVRQWIMENVPAHSIAMVDDDLSFHVRRKDDPTKFLPAKPKDIKKMFDTFAKHLTKYAHVSCVGRQGGNRVLEDQECARPWHIFCFNVAKFREAGVSFGGGLLQDDFDITLQLLKKGYPNRIVAAYAVNQHHGHAAPGGASCYRSLEDHNKSVRLLQSRHPEFIRVHEKTYSSGGMPGTRLETVVSWKKAFKSSGGSHAR